MERNRLKKVVHEESRKHAKEAALKRREETAKRLSNEARDRRNKPFNAIRDRHNQAVDKVKEFCEVRGNSWDRADSINEPRARRSGVLVVLENAPKSPLTPDHVAICVMGIETPYDLSYLREPQLQAPKSQRIFYKFAFIPRQFLQATQQEVGYPLGCVPKNELNSDLVREETSYTLDGIEAERVKANYTEGSIPHWLRYRSTLKGLSESMNQGEATLNWVLGAANNVELNPHLHTSAQSTAE